MLKIPFDDLKEKLATLGSFSPTSKILEEQFKEYHKQFFEVFQDGWGTGMIFPLSKIVFSRSRVSSKHSFHSVSEMYYPLYLVIQHVKMNIHFIKLTGGLIIQARDFCTAQTVLIAQYLN